MPEDKPRRLNEVVSSLAPEGANDIAWFMVEHQLVQVRMSANVIIEGLKDILIQPENEDERETATACLDIMKGMLLDILEHRATFLSYVSGTDVPERISRKEL